MMRSGRRKSSTPEPSRRNSGLLTTATSGRSSNSAVRSAVPTGTVDLSTTTAPAAGASRTSSIDRLDRGAGPRSRRCPSGSARRRTGPQRECPRASQLLETGADTDDERQPSRRHRLGHQLGEPRLPDVDLVRLGAARPSPRRRRHRPPGDPATRGTPPWSDPRIRCPPPRCGARSPTSVLLTVAPRPGDHASPGRADNHMRTKRPHVAVWQRCHSRLDCPLRRYRRPGPGSRAARTGGRTRPAYRSRGRSSCPARPRLSSPCRGRTPCCRLPPSYCC